MKDRSMKAILAMYDGVAVVLIKHQLVGTALFERIYAGKEPSDTDFNRRGQIHRSAFVPSGEDDKLSFLVYSFGWSRYQNKPCRSYSHEWHDGPHDKRCLERHNSDDWRLKDWDEGPLEQLAGTQAHLMAEKDWEARWRDELGFDQELIGAFHAYTVRDRQLWYRKGFYMSQLARIVRSHLAAQEKDLYQVRTDRNDRMGPVIDIDGRTFFFEGESLREGMPWETFTFDGSEGVIEREHHGWWGCDERKHGRKTHRVHEYLAGKKREQKAREERRQKAEAT